MLRYIIKRLLMVFFIVLCVVFVFFILLSTLPGAQIDSTPIYGDGDALDSAFAFFNVGDNLFFKYIRYCYNIAFHFDFGLSSARRHQVSDELRARVRVTLIILACSASASLAIGVSAGIFAAVRKDRFWDRIINVVTLFLSSIPNYAMAMVIVLLLCVYLRILPMMLSKRSPIIFFMPTLVAMLGGVASILRVTRASMLEVLEQPYITALRAKGLSEAGIIYRHALKNALIPVVSSLGGFVSQMVCGTFVVERYFNVEGLGLYMLSSVVMRSHYEMLGCAVVMAVILAVTNVAIDILYTIISPQIKLRHVKIRSEAYGKANAA